MAEGTLSVWNNLLSAMSTSYLPLKNALSLPRDQASAKGVYASRLSSVTGYLQRQWVRVLVIVSLAIVVHAPGMQGDRIWDDNFLVLNNPFIKSPVLILESFRHFLFLDSLSAHYRPVQNVSFLIDYFFWNTDTWGFHLTNVLLHAGSGVVLYFLLRRLFVLLLLRPVRPAAENNPRNSSSPGNVRLKGHKILGTVAFLVAVLWTVHPVHSAAVDYISGRADSLAFLFCAGGWLLFIQGRNASRLIVRSLLYFAAAVCGLLALCSREIAFMWMALFIVHLFIDETIPARVRIWTLAACVAVISLYLGFRHLPGQRPIASPESWDARVRATMMARSLGDYARLMIFPNKLHMERTVLDPRPLFSNRAWRDGIGIEYLSVIGLIALVALVLASIKKGRGQPLRIFGASWFFGAYLPISNIVQLNATVAEHWLYLPSVGFLIFVAGCALDLPRNCQRLVPVFAVVAIIALSARSFVRSSDWADEETFYTRTLESGSRSARVACNLGQLYSKRHEYARAERIIRLVLQDNPNYPIAQNNLADLYFRQGKLTEAETLFAKIEEDSRQTRKEYSRTWIGGLNHAIARHNKGDDEAALAILDKTRGEYPGVWDPLALELEILRKKNRIDEALPLAEEFSRHNWWHYGAAFALGTLYFQKGDIGRAEAALLQASRLDVHDANALRTIAQMRVYENRLNDAFRIQQQAIARQPDEPRQYVFLSDILEKMGRNAEAHAALAKASRLREVVTGPSEAGLTPAL